jgi:hypothetical protein
MALSADAVLASGYNDTAAGRRSSDRSTVNQWKWNNLEAVHLEFPFRESGNGCLWVLFRRNF